MVVEETGAMVGSLGHCFCCLELTFRLECGRQTCGIFERDKEQKLDIYLGSGFFMDGTGKGLALVSEFNALVGMFKATGSRTLTL